MVEVLIIKRNVWIRFTFIVTIAAFPFPNPLLPSGQKGKKMKSKEKKLRIFFFSFFMFCMDYEFCEEKIKIKTIS